MNIKRKNIKNKCGECKHFVLLDKNKIFGVCTCEQSRIKNKINRSIFSSACISKEKKDEQ